MDSPLIPLIAFFGLLNLLFTVLVTTVAGRQIVAFFASTAFGVLAVSLGYVADGAFLVGIAVQLAIPLFYTLIFE